MESYNFPCSKNSLFPNVFLDKGQPSPALCPSTPFPPGQADVWIFPSTAQGLRMEEKVSCFPHSWLFPVLQRLGDLCWGLQIKQWAGAALETGGALGIFPSGIPRLLVAGPDGTAVCLWRPSFSLNQSCKQEYEVLFT